MVIKHELFPSQKRGVGSWKKLVEIFIVLFHYKMAEFEENSILQKFLDLIQNGTPVGLALFGVAQSEALM